MFKWNVFSKPDGLGLDIKTHKIRLLQLQHRRFCINTLRDEVLIPSLPITTCLSEWVSQLKIAGKKVAIALPQSSLMTRRIRLQAMLPERQYYQEIAAQLDQYFPEAADELCFDFIKCTGPSVRVMAVRKTLLQQYVSQVERAGLIVSAVDIDCYALIRALDFFMRPIQIEAILDLSSDPSRFMVLKQQEIIFQQEWNHNITHDQCDMVASSLKAYRLTQGTSKLNSLILLETTASQLAEWIEQEYQLHVYKPTLPGSMQLDALVSFGLALRGYA